MPNTKPFVAAAFICEKVLREEGDIFSAIRIVDQYTIKMMTIQAMNLATQVAGPLPVMGTALDMSALVIVKAGDVTGKHEISIVIRNPEGKETPFPQTFPIEFKAENPAEGAALNIRFMMPGEAKGGLYWINVLWNGEVLTSIPLRLIKESESPGTV